MAAQTQLAEYYLYNIGESAWEKYWFQTRADMVLTADTGLNFVTDEEKDDIGTYIDPDSFNTALKLVLLNADGVVPQPNIPDLSSLYLPVTGGTITSNLELQGTFTLGGIGGTSSGEIMGKINPVDSKPYGSLNFTNYTHYDFNNKNITNVLTPSAGTDAANKAYVDGLVAIGTRPVSAVKVATTENMTLTGLGTFDGYTVAAGDRILVWKQTLATANGIYTASATAWTKVTADSTQGAYVFVENGNTYNDWYFFCQNNTGTWIDHGRPDTVKAGTGLTKSGTTIGIVNGGITDTQINGTAGIDLAKLKSTKINPESLAAIGNLSNPNDTTAISLTAHLGNLYNMIRFIRGTETFLEASTKTISGAYLELGKKSRVYTGDAVPGVISSASDKDIYIRKLPVQ